MDYKSIRTILDSSRDKLEDLALRIACEYPEEFRKCAIMNGLVDDIEIVCTWDKERVEIKSSVMNQIRDYAAANRKVEAVKAIREATGIGLKDALETIKMLFPQFAEQPRPIVNPASEVPLTFFDRRPTDPGYVAPERDRYVYHGNEEDDFDNWRPPAMPDNFNDDQPRGVTLGELLRDQIKLNEAPANPDPVDWSRFRVDFDRDNG